MSATPTRTVPAHESDRQTRRGGWYLMLAADGSWQQMNLPDGFRAPRTGSAEPANLGEPAGESQLHAFAAAAKACAAAAAREADRAEMALVAVRVRRRFPAADALVYEARTADVAHLAGVRLADGRILRWFCPALSPASTVPTAHLPAGDGTIRRVVPFAGLA